jgi:hypothetical protein
MLINAQDNIDGSLLPSPRGPVPVVAQAAAKAPSNVGLMSHPLSAFISEDTVASITKLVAEKFQGKKGLIGFGYTHQGVPLKKRFIVPTEEYLADNLEAIVKANNIKVIAMESSSD